MKSVRRQPVKNVVSAPSAGGALRQLVPKGSVGRGPARLGTQTQSWDFSCSTGRAVSALRVSLCGQTLAPGSDPADSLRFLPRGPLAREQCASDLRHPQKAFPHSDEERAFCATTCILARLPAANSMGLGLPGGTWEHSGLQTPMK